MKKTPTVLCQNTFFPNSSNVNSRIVQRFDTKSEAAALPSNSVHLDYKNVVPQFSILIDTLQQVNTVNHSVHQKELKPNMGQIFFSHTKQLNNKKNHLKKNRQKIRCLVCGQTSVHGSLRPQKVEGSRILQESGLISCQSTLSVFTQCMRLYLVLRTTFTFCF